MIVGMENFYYAWGVSRQAVSYMKKQKICKALANDLTISWRIQMIQRSKRIMLLIHMKLQILCLQQSILIVQQKCASIGKNVVNVLKQIS